MSKSRSGSEKEVSREPVATRGPVDAGSSARRWWILATVGLAQLMVVLDITVVNVALPSAQADLGFSDGDRQWVITAYSLVFGGLLLLGGRLSDLIGRRRTLITGLIGFGAASALGGAADSFALLIAARALQGVFAALLGPTALATLTTTFTSPRERARAFGVLAAVVGAGGAVGLLLGGVLTQLISWRWSLYINVFIAVVAVLGAVVFIAPMRRSGPRPRLDVPGSLLVTGASVVLVYGFSNVESAGWGSPLTWGALSLSGVLVASFVAWQQRAPQPLLPLGILADRDRATAYVSVLVTAVGMFGMFLFTTYYMQTLLHYSPLRTGLSFLPMVVALVATSQFSSGTIVPRVGAKVIVPTGMAIVAVGMVLLARLDLNSDYVTDLLPAMVALGIGLGSITPAAMHTATLDVDRRYAGVASALVNTCQQLGGSVGTALLNTVAAAAASSYIASHSPSTPAVITEAAMHSDTTVYWTLAAGFSGAAALTAVTFRRRPAGRSRPGPAASTTEERIALIP